MLVISEDIYKDKDHQIERVSINYFVVSVWRDSLLQHLAYGRAVMSGATREELGSV